MPKPRKRTPKPAAPVRRGLVSPTQLEAFLVRARERGLTQDVCTLDELPAFVASLQTAAGFTAVRDALTQAHIDLCAPCLRAGRASVAVEHVEVDTGMRSVGDFVYACATCRPAVIAATT
jgi:hypothetical protein